MRKAGYPNAQQTLKALGDSREWSIQDNADWLPEDIHLWRVARGPWMQRMGLALRLGLGSAASAVRCLLSIRRGDLAFAPYPAIFVLWWLSWVPRPLRPNVIADAYISIWDTMFRDRSRSNQPGRANRWLKAIEARALRSAHRVIVDTVANRDWMMAEFGLEPDRIHALPLAIEAAPFLAIPPPALRAPERPLRVLFVGTLVPLHGIDRIAGAIRLLGADSGIEFEIIGDGQEAGALEALALINGHAPLRWTRSWLRLDEIADRMLDADVCLGVFGGGAKAARVLPYKLYMALAAGRAIVTQAACSLPAEVPQPPWLAIPPTAEALAGALTQLRDRPEEAVGLGMAARAHFLAHLSTAALPARWERLLRQ
jgi:glycosyltransferase involved in cell wall biosynthesis